MHDESPGPVDDFLDRCLRGERVDVAAFLAGQRELPAGERDRVAKIARVFLDGDAAAVAATAPDDAPPRATVGDFRLLRKLGEGGMGVVWLAEQMALRRVVAVKLLRTSALASARGAERFQRESRTVARLRHPGIVPVLAAGVDEGVPWLAMEYVDGRSLDEIAADAVARRERVRPLDAVRWCRDIARALAGAHAEGIVHRDVKPSNVRVASDGRALLLDFGLARAADEPRISVEGHFVGSPSYAAPEQIEPSHAASAPPPGAPADGRCDVYSLGVVLYELAVGRVPFEGRSTREVFQQILHREPKSPRALDGAISRELEAVILHALEKEPARRYATAAEFADDLDALLEMRPIRARPSGVGQRLVKWARREPAAALAAALGVLLVVGGPLAYALFEQRATARIAREHDEVMRLSDGVTVRQLAAEAKELWPRRAALVPKLMTWLAAADEVMKNEPGHRAALERWRAQEQAASGAPDTTLAWRITTSEELLAGMARLRATADDLHARLAVASTIRRDTIDAHEKEWAEAIEAIAQSPRFSGLELSPQEGLVPIGRDPESGFEEFWMPESGERPVRDATSGHWSIGERTGVVLILLPGGTFQLGNPDPEGNAKWRAKPSGYSLEIELPAHEVTIAPYFVGKYELTQGQWERIGGINTSYDRPRSLFSNDSDLSYPVEHMSHSTAVDVLRRSGLRLPSEAQWEFAARGGTSTPWWTGDWSKTVEGAGNVGDQSMVRTFGADATGTYEKWDDGFPFPAPVGRFKQNPFGLHDTMGNVAEWCADEAAPYTDPVVGPDALRRPTAPVADVTYVERGGGFHMIARECNVFRRCFFTDPGMTFIGLRVARMLDP